MRYPSYFLFLSLLMIAIPALSATTGEPPVVAVLRYSDGWFAPRAKIRMQTGTVVSPLAKSPQIQWKLLPGDALKVASPPIERLIQFYNIKDNDTRLLCTVIVKYQRTANGWQPGFALVQPATASGDDEKSEMDSDEGVVHANIKVLATDQADGEGFHGYLIFAGAEGPVSIDAWEVQ